MGRVVINNRKARNFKVRTYHTIEEDGERRFRLLSGIDGSYYIRTEAGRNGNWEEGHFHNEVIETYIVQEGWCGCVTKKEGIISYKRYLKNDIFTVHPGVLHNIYMAKDAVTHTVKHGIVKIEDRIVDKEFTDTTSKISEEMLIHLIEAELKADKMTPQSIANENRPEKETFWELFEERRHLENIVNTRFNFFLVIFGIILASLVTLKSRDQLLFVLISGTFIEAALSLTIIRAEKKLNFYLNVIRNTPNHAERAANGFANSRNNFILLRGSRHWILGYGLPVLICSALLLSIVFNKKLFYLLSPDTPENEVKIQLQINGESLKNLNAEHDTSKTFHINLMNIKDAREDSI